MVRILRHRTSPRGAMNAACKPNPPSVHAMSASGDKYWPKYWPDKYWPVFERTFQVTTSCGQAAYSASYSASYKACRRLAGLLV